MVVLVCRLGMRSVVLGRWLSAVIECSSLVDLLSCWGWGHVVVLVVAGAGHAAGAARLGEVVPYEIVGRRAREPQGPGERPPPLCELETTRVGVQVCPSARQPMTRVRDELGQRIA
jgi:hypothetical protein